MRSLQHITHIFSDLSLSHLLPSTHIIYNDNEACVNWNAKMTTKGLRYIQIRENSSRELQKDGFCSIQHIGGHLNLSDLFTKEDKDVAHFTQIRDAIMKILPHSIASAYAVSVLNHSANPPTYNIMGNMFNSSTLQSLSIFYLCSHLRRSTESPSWRHQKGSVRSM